uniref:Uncharacterized protein n=1 Tax=Panstrongylus lignarius TaxID=156445 RepID=A0A224Y457_9HEMI
MFGGFLMMYVFSLWLNCSNPWKPHALQPWLIVSFFELTLKSVSGLSHSGHNTNLRINPSNKSCNLAASCDPLTI